MYSVLNVTDDITHCGHIGHVVPDFRESCSLASRHGFGGVNVNLRPTVRLAPADYRRILDESGLEPVSFGFPAHLFGSDAEFEPGVAEFEAQARLASEIGCHLTLCYIPPFSDDLNFNDRFVRTVERLRRLAPSLRRHEIRIGFEFIGPTETRRETAYDFIHTIDGTRADRGRGDLRPRRLQARCPPLAAQRRRPAGSPPLRPGIPALRRAE